MDAVIETSESDALSEGQRVLLELLKDKHDLADDQTFAMWLTVPMMASRQKWALLAAGVMVVVAALLVLVAGAPTLVFAAPGVGLLAALLLTERHVLSWGSSGLLLHKPVKSKLDAGEAAELERDGSTVVIRGAEYRADSHSLETLTRLMA